MLLVNLFGLALIGLIIWWFWLYRPEQVDADSAAITVRVEHGVYQPAHIHLTPDQASVISFERVDESPCAEMVLFPDLEISESLPVKRVKTIRIPPLKPGEYEFHCQMQMYRGKLIVAG